MAGLTLSVVVIILTQLRRPTWPVLIPLVFVTVMSLWAAVLQLRGSHLGLSYLGGW